MAFNNQLKEEFDRDGFVLVEGYLSSGEATEINKHIQRFIDEVLPAAPDTTAFYEDRDDPASIKRLQNMADLDPYFGELFQSDRFTSLAGFLLADDVVPKNPQWFNKPAHVGAVTPPHQDGFYFMLDPNEAITLWIALDDIDEENGCMRYVRGSHRRGMRPHRPSNILGFSQGVSDYSDEDLGAGSGDARQTGGPVRPSQHDHTPGGRQPVRPPPGGAGPGLLRGPRQEG